MSQSKTLIVGHNGFLGSILQAALAADSVGREALDLSQSISPTFVARLNEHRYDYVVICAAMADIEQCFLQPDLSEQINVRGTREVLDAIRASGAVPVFFSSDYVFAYTTTPHLEGDPRTPTTQYGLQKLKIELHLESHFKDYLLFRTGKLMSKTLHARNILTPILRSLQAGQTVNCFVDQWINPVFVEDVAAVLKIAQARSLRGQFHLGTRGVYTRADLGRHLAMALNLDPNLIVPIRMAEVPVSEPRPSHNLLACGKIESAADFCFTELEDAMPALKALVL